MTAYYNEIDPYAAQWLRNLINAGHIAPGIVDERSIEDVYPSDLRGFTQCHFFAGIGVWSHALRSAGWSDDRPVWTGSCPCQPFSAAGAGAGFSDERHLWPAFHHLIEQCRPSVVFGEQVASKDANPWIDLVQTDLEAMGYGVGAVAFPSAGVGAPHIRDRLYWVANAQRERVCPCQRGKDAGTPRSLQGADGQRQRLRLDAGELCGVCGLADAQHDGRDRQAGSAPVADSNESRQRLFDGDSAASGLADANSGQCEQQPSDERPAGVFGKTHAAQGFVIRPCDPGPGDGCGPGPVNGHWANADWLFCRDGKWRPVEPGSFPLVDGAPSRVGRLRAYGNAINAKAAQAFIECVM